MCDVYFELSAIDYWGPRKHVLGDLHFLQTLKEFNNDDNISINTTDIMRKTYDPDLKPSITSKASSDVKGLCKWIVELDMCDKMIKIVDPKKEKLDITQTEFQATVELLGGHKNEELELKKSLNALKERLRQTVLNKRKLQAEVKLCKSKLLKTEKIISQ